MRQWREEAILLQSQRHGENAAIIQALTEGQGKISGLVRGGATKRMAAVLQPGNRVLVEYKARLAAHLGTLRVEPVVQRAGLLLHDRDRLLAASAMTALLCFALPEDDPHPRLTRATELLLDRLATGEAWRSTYLQWEVLLLEELGFGLDLTRCAVTGTQDGLAFVSPKTGRAVSLQGAGNWAARLLALPSALQLGHEAGRGEMGEGLRMTGHFLANWLAPALGDRPLPPVRARLQEAFDHHGA